MASAMEGLVLGIEWEIGGGGGYLNVYEGVLVYVYSFWRVRVDFVWGGRAWLF